MEPALLVDRPLAPGVDIGELYRLTERRFPVLTEPPTVPTREIGFEEDDWVVGLAGEREVRAYPVTALARHHVVNDMLDEPVLVSFCIMCSTGMCFDPVVDSRRLVFDVFGHYRLNMAMEDHQTRTVWSQMDGSAIAGDLVGTNLAWIASETTQVGHWLRKHPDSRSPASMRPGRGNDPLTLGLSSRRTERRDPLVFGVVVDGIPVAYRSGEPSAQAWVVQDNVGEAGIVIIADKDALPAVYRRRVADQTLDFRVADGRIVAGGSTWSGGGLALDGPLAGKRLEVIPSRMTRRRQWQSFHPDTEVRDLRR